MKAKHWTDETNSSQVFGLKSNQTNLGIRCIATFQLLGINARSMLLNYQRKILANLRLPPCCVLLNIYKQQGWLDFSVLTSCHVMTNLKIAWSSACAHISFIDGDGPPLPVFICNQRWLIMEPSEAKRKCFSRLSVEEIQNLIEGKDSENTRKATKNAVVAFLAYWNEVNRKMSG